jgi:hypothetical protein
MKIKTRSDFSSDKDYAEYLLDELQAIMSPPSPRTAADMDPRIMASARRAMQAYKKLFGPAIDYAGGAFNEDHLAQFIAVYLGASGWIRKRRLTDHEDHPDPEAVKARCGVEVIAERVTITDKEQA